MVHHLIRVPASRNRHQETGISKHRGRETSRPATIPAVPDAPIPVLWLTGPPGVGKTTAAWALFTELTREQWPVAYVDIDQVGMCYPARQADPERHELKALNLDALLSHYRAAGATAVVVSGISDPRVRPPLPHARLTLCRLHTTVAELDRRFLSRQQNQAALAEIHQEAAELDRSRTADVTIDATGLTPERTACRARASWTPAAAGRAGPGTPLGLPGNVLWVTGPRGVGKSTVANLVYRRVLATGRTAGYLDLRQLTFCSPRDEGLGVRAVAAVWRNYRDAGATYLVVAGDGGPAPAAAAEYRLTAGLAALTERILRRGRGESEWAEPGDPLKGRPVSELHRVARSTAAAADRSGIDTTGRTPAEMADLIVARSGWPG
jgi:adenylylsulfate kinase-like enzyme